MMKTKVTMMTTIKRNIVIFLLCIVFFSAIFSVRASADIAPKPSICVDFDNMGDKPCYVTLLSENFTNDKASYENDVIFSTFNSYKDPDGFSFSQNYWRCDDTKKIKTVLYTAQRFKILLYYPEEGVFSVSEICERYAFDSRIIVELSDDGNIIAVRKSSNNNLDIPALFCRIAITTVIEILVAFIFLIFKPMILLVVLATNIITQTALSLLLSNAVYEQGQFMSGVYLLVGEAVVLFTEATIYEIVFRLFGECISDMKPLIYAFAANVISFLVGEISPI